MNEWTDVFGDRLRQLRKTRGVTQEKLAREIGVDRSSIGKYEGKDKVYPSREVLSAVADYFNVSVDYLLGRTDDMQNAGVKDRITILARGAKKLSEEDQKKLLDVARALFGKVFDE